MKKSELIRLIQMWMLGLEIPLSLLDDDKVKWELAQKQIDGVGLLNAFKERIYGITNGNTKEACKNLNDPRYQLELITLINNDSMVYFR